MKPLRRVSGFLDSGVQMSPRRWGSVHRHPFGLSGATPMFVPIVVPSTLRDGERTTDPGAPCGRRSRRPGSQGSRLAPRGLSSAAGTVRHPGLTVSLFDLWGSLREENSVENPSVNVRPLEKSAYMCLERPIVSPDDAPLEPRPSL